MHQSLDAARIVEKEDGLSVEVLDLRTLLPLDREAILATARKTGKVLIVHEDRLTGGIGGEVAAIIAEHAFEYLDGPIRRVAALDTHIAFSPPLEEFILPNTNKIVDAIREPRGVLSDGRHVDRSNDAADGRECRRRHRHQVAGQGRRPRQEDQPLCEISTDKVDTEIPSPGAGVIAKLVAAEGETLPVGAPLAVIEASGAQAASAPAGVRTQPKAAPAPAARRQGRAAGAPPAAARPQQAPPTLRAVRSEPRPQRPRLRAQRRLRGGARRKRAVAAAAPQRARARRRW